MEALLNIIRREVERAVAARKHIRHGIVDSYDPQKHAAKVTFQPEGQISGWLPIGTAWMGNKWGLFTPPSPGDHVTYYYEKGDVGSGVLVHRHWNDVDQPLDVPAGEAWMIHKKTQGFKMSNDGTMTVIGPKSNAATLNPDGSILIEAKAGDVTVQSDGATVYLISPPQKTKAVTDKNAKVLPVQLVGGVAKTLYAEPV